LKGAENASYKITSNDVELRQPSKQAQNASSQMASSKIKVNKIVNYDWEHKYYYGNIMSVHKNGDILVYALRSKLISFLIFCNYLKEAFILLF
jgi:hypothetical protein